MAFSRSYRHLFIRHLKHLLVQEQTFEAGLRQPSSSANIAKLPDHVMEIKANHATAASRRQNNTP
jgi:hypothetical protein